MKKQKLNSITFHDAAKKLVDQYFGEIPFYCLQTSNDVKTEKGKTEQSFQAYYRNRNYKAETFDMFTTEETPDMAIAEFENKIKLFWDIPIIEQPIEPFDFKYFPTKNQ